MEQPKATEERESMPQTLEDLKESLINFQSSELPDKVREAMEELLDRVEEAMNASTEK